MGNRGAPCLAESALRTPPTPQLQSQDGALVRIADSATAESSRLELARSRTPLRQCRTAAKLAGPVNPERPSLLSPLAGSPTLPRQSWERVHRARSVKPARRTPPTLLLQSEKHQSGSPQARASLRSRPRDSRRGFPAGNSAAAEPAPPRHPRAPPWQSLSVDKQALPSPRTA